MFGIPAMGGIPPNGGMESIASSDSDDAGLKVEETRTKFIRAGKNITFHHSPLDS